MCAVTEIVKVSKDFVNGENIFRWNVKVYE